MRRPAVPAIVAVALIALTSLVAPGAVTHRPVAPSWPSARGTTDARSAGNTSINDIVNVNQTSPVGTFAPGSLLQVDYRVSLVTTPFTPSATVYVPGMDAVFPALPVPVQVFLPPHNLTMASGATVTAASTSLSLRNSTSFNATHGANLNSELVSVMSSEPFGNSSVVVQWNWTMRSVDGAYATSGWGPSNGTPIHPAEVAFLQSLEPRTVLPPATVTACLTGPIASRTFSLHAETARPVDDFVANTSRVPAGGASTFCLSVAIPTSVTPQTILMHVWDYESVTLLLYIVKVRVVNATSAASPALVPPGWTTIADAGLVVGALALAGVVALAVRREPRTPGPAPPTGRAEAPGTPPTLPPEGRSPPDGAAADAARSTR